MRILYVSIYDRNGENVFTYVRDDVISSDQVLRYSSFTHCLMTFVEQTLHSKITRIDFTNCWIDLVSGRKYTAIIYSEIESADFAEKLGFSINVRNFAMAIKNLLDSGEIEYDLHRPSMLKLQIELNLSSMDAEPDIPRDKITNEDDWKIVLNYICEPSGMPIHYRHYGSQPLLDPVLISGVLSSINAFSNIYLDNPVQCVHLGDIKLFFKSRKELLFALGVQFSNSEQHMVQPDMEESINELLENIGNTLDVAYDSNAENQTDELSKIFDEYLSETIGNFLPDNT